MTPPPERLTLADEETMRGNLWRGIWYALLLTAIGAAAVAAVFGGGLALWKFIYG